MRNDEAEGEALGEGSRSTRRVPGETVPGTVTVPETEVTVGAWWAWWACCVWLWWGCAWVWWAW
ncbi:hypothetical protein BDW75DRAFT_207225 [Aspergillus navahoensis]